MDDVELVNFPDVCPEEPCRVRGGLFCEKHVEVAKAANLPTNAKDLKVEHVDASDFNLQGK